jgi:hypothetical protein
MGLRFRRSITIFPGVRLNVGQGGLSFSFGPRGSSLTAGPRGMYANVGLPGTGLSYRTRIDIPAPAPLRAFTRPETSVPRPSRSFEQHLRAVLADRERGSIDWPDRALWLAEAPPDEEDEFAFDDYSRRMAAGRFARRMVEGDRAAWSEVLREELINEELPFDYAFEWGVEESPERIYVGVQIPDIAIVNAVGLATMKSRELHEDVCCGLVLRIAHEVFRVIPETNDLYLTGYMDGIDPANGRPVRNIYLRLATDRESFDELVLDQVDPSSAFGALGGLSKVKRGELVALSSE